MFSANTYKSRRAELRKRIGSGLILIAGNTYSPNNYPNNAYYFRQDSTFLYYFGLNLPTLMAVIDAESGEEMLFGDDLRSRISSGQVLSRASLSLVRRWAYRIASL